MGYNFIYSCILCSEFIIEIDVLIIPKSFSKLQNKIAFMYMLINFYSPMLLKYFKK